MSGSSATFVTQTLAVATRCRGVFVLWIPLFGLEVWVEEVSLIEVGATTIVRILLIEDVTIGTHFRKMEV